MTLRASAPGYVSKAQTIIPYSETIDRTLTRSIGPVTTN